MIGLSLSARFRPGFRLPRTYRRSKNLRRLCLRNLFLKPKIVAQNLTENFNTYNAKCQKVLSVSIPLSCRPKIRAFSKENPHLLRKESYLFIIQGTIFQSLTFKSSSGCHLCSILSIISSCFTSLFTSLLFSLFDVRSRSFFGIVWNQTLKMTLWEIRFYF